MTNYYLFALLWHVLKLVAISTLHIVLHFDFYLSNWNLWFYINVHHHLYLFLVNMFANKIFPTLRSSPSITELANLLPRHLSESINFVFPQNYICNRLFNSWGLIGNPFNELTAVWSISHQHVSPLYIRFRFRCPLVESRSLELFVKARLSLKADMIH